MTTPTQQIVQRGSFANDGTGDTLRDAAQKINDNFTYLWTEVWDITDSGGASSNILDASPSGGATDDF